MQALRRAWEPASACPPPSGCSKSAPSSWAPSPNSSSKAVKSYPLASGTLGSTSSSPNGPKRLKTWSTAGASKPQLDRRPELLRNPPSTKILAPIPPRMVSSSTTSGGHIPGLPQDAAPNERGPPQNTHLPSTSYPLLHPSRLGSDPSHTETCGIRPALSRCRCLSCCHPVGICFCFCFSSFPRNRLL